MYGVASRAVKKSFVVGHGARSYGEAGRCVQQLYRQQECRRCGHLHCLRLVITSRSGGSESYSWMRLSPKVVGSSIHEASSPLSRPKEALVGLFLG